jgi:hypothetical protein
VTEARLPRWLAPAADTVVVLVFVGVGLRSHHDESGAAAFLRVLWPFGVGLLLGYLATDLLRRPLAWARAAGAWIVIVATGEVLRLTAQHRPFRPGFLVVATLFIGACMFGWRLGAVALQRRRERLSPRR